MNTQKQESAEHDATGLLAVHSAFLTIQGEGPYAGFRAVFIRLAGCNLQCPWCDTEYTSRRESYSPSAIVTLVTTILLRERKHALSPTAGHLIVFTGGEPFRQNLVPAVWALRSAGFNVQIETNGTIWLDDLPDDITIVCSPKTAEIHPKMKRRVDAFKYVVDMGNVNIVDGLPNSSLGQHYKKPIARPRPGAPIYVQPMDMGAGNEQRTALNVSLARDLCLEFGYTFCLQIHKFLNLP